MRTSSAAPRTVAPFAHAHDYPGDLAELFARCARALERAAGVGSGDSAVRAFRAGAYRAQPFGRISAALASVGIACDSSVFRGGVSGERGHDYTHAFSSHQPYFCSPDDPQLLARPGEDAILELPIATLEFGRRWSADGADQARFGDDLLDYLDTRKGVPGGPLALWRARERLSTLLERISRGRFRRLPRHPAHAPAGELRHGNEYFVAIGHTKGEHDFATLAAQLARINQAAPAEWVTLGEMAELAREDLSRTEAWRTARAAAGSPLAVGSTATAPSLDAVAAAVERALPWPGSEARVLGDRACELAALLEPRFPWKSFAASEATGGTGSERSSFATLILAPGTSVSAATLRAWAGALGPDGRLVVPVALETERLAYPQLPSARSALLREWRYRLETAGFRSVRVHEIPDGRVAGVVVATPEKERAARDQLLAAMDWLYQTVAPADDPTVGLAPRDVLGAKRALVVSTPAELRFAEDAAARLGDMAAGLFPEAVMHTPIETVRAARQRAQQRGADCYVAIGGGSTVGTAKAIALETGLPVVAVPTTYAGSEMTPIYGITEGQLKKTGRDYKVLPKTVIYDVNLTLSLPPHISGPSGMNAMAHCVEGLYAQDTNPIVVLMAAEGIRALGRSLPAVVKEPDNIEARSDAQYGAWLAGTVLGSAGTAVKR